MEGPTWRRRACLEQGPGRARSIGRRSAIVEGRPKAAAVTAKPVLHPRRPSRRMAELPQLRAPTHSPRQAAHRRGPDAGALAPSPGTPVAPGVRLGDTGGAAPGAPGTDAMTGSWANAGAEGRLAPGPGGASTGTPRNRELAIEAIQAGSGAEACAAAALSNSLVTWHGSAGPARAQTWRSCGYTRDTCRPLRSRARQAHPRSAPQAMSRARRDRRRWPCG